MMDKQVWKIVKLSSVPSNKKLLEINGYLKEKPALSFTVYLAVLTQAELMCEINQYSQLSHLLSVYH